MKEELQVERGRRAGEKVEDSFEETKRVRETRALYEALGGELGGELHSLRVFGIELER